jgi:predicted alpha/beta hydrolase family esterase
MSELIPVVVNPSALADVIFVHGLDGDAHDTWQADGTSASFWPRWLGEELPQLAVWTLDYDAHALKWTGASMPLLDRAANVLDLMDVKIPAPRPMFFVVHSLGGLLVKQMFRRAVDRSLPMARNMRGVVFLATPHSGSEKASWLSNFGALLRTSVTVQELQAHSAQLRDLDIWYRDKVASLNIPHRVYYETRAIKGLMIVDATSADPGIANTAPIALDADHISIAKPSSKQDQMFLGVLQFLRLGLKVPNRAVSPITVRYQIKALDGRTATDIGGFTAALPDGAKFRLQLTNSGPDRALIDSLRLSLKYQTLPAGLAAKIEADALRFGNARVPHQLHLALTESSWTGTWMVQMSNGTGELRKISENQENLLDTDPPTEFDLGPGETESITGAIAVTKPGLYEVCFEIGSAVLGETAAPMSTQTLILFKS